MFDDYIIVVIKVVENYVSSDLFIIEFGGEVVNKVEEVKNILCGYFVCKWMVENNFMFDVVIIMNDIVVLFVSNEGDDLVFNMYVDYINYIFCMIVKLFKDICFVVEVVNRDIIKIIG